MAVRRKGRGSGYQCWDFFQRIHGIIYFWDFLELVELSVLRCFTHGLLNDPLLTASLQSAPPLRGSCLWPGVPLDRVMGQCSLLAIFTYLVSYWQQDGGGTVCFMLKLWDEFDQKNEKWSKNGNKRGTRGKGEKMHCNAFLMHSCCKTLVSDKSDIYFLHNGIDNKSKICCWKSTQVFFSVGICILETSADGFANIAIKYLQIKSNIW